MKPAIAAPPHRGLTPQMRRTLTVLFAIILAFMVFKLIFAHHDNDYEKIAHEVTVGLQSNDLAAVQKYENAETATQVNRQRVGRAADQLAPLGKLKSVRETSADAATRIHTFNLTFDKGTMAEQIKFDPEKKIVRFHYDSPVIK